MAPQPIATKVPATRVNPFRAFGRADAGPESTAARKIPAESAFTLGYSGHRRKMAIFCSYFENNTPWADALFFIGERKFGPRSPGPEALEGEQASRDRSPSLMLDLVHFRMAWSKISPL